jgi:thioredoxin 1
MVTIYRFTADWCGPCKVMGPTIERIGEEYRDKGVNVKKINVDDNQELVAQYGVRSIPTLVFEKDGKEVDRTVGNQSYDEIVSRIKQHG